MRGETFIWRNHISCPVGSPHLDFDIFPYFWTPVFASLGPTLGGQPRSWVAGYQPLPVGGGPLKKPAPPSPPQSSLPAGPTGRLHRPPASGLPPQRGSAGVGNPPTLRDCEWFVEGGGREGRRVGWPPLQPQRAIHTPSPQRGSTGVVNPTTKRSNAVVQCCRAVGGGVGCSSPPAEGLPRGNTEGLYVWFDADCNAHVDQDVSSSKLLLHFKTSHRAKNPSYLKTPFLGSNKP